MSRRGRRRGLKLPEVSLTPMVDMALTLLVIFMVAVPVMHHGLHLKLPKGESVHESMAKADFTIEMDEHGSCLCNEKAASLDTIVSLAKNHDSDLEDLTFQVRASEKIQYGRVVLLVERLKQLGVKSIGLALEG